MINYACKRCKQHIKGQIMMLQHTSMTGHKSFYTLATPIKFKTPKKLVICKICGMKPLNNPESRKKKMCMRCLNEKEGI
jgi:hypothetical protein